MSPYRLSAAVFFLSLGCGIATVQAAETRIAVTDLTYEEKVSAYFRTVSATSKSQVDARASEREDAYGYAARGSYSGRAESSYQESEGIYTYIDRGELRTYTADLKGALLKDGRIRLVQARPYVGKPMERIHDIVGRIKQGLYPGADYVLFGSVSNIAFRQESMPLAMGSSSTANLTLDLVVDFSLINTRTFEVKAAFSSSGSGQDTKIISRAGDRLVHNRSKVMQETSRSLADNTYAELIGQLGIAKAARAAHTAGDDALGGRDGSANMPRRDAETRAGPAMVPAAPVTIYR